ncbi:MAG: hypothetical protein J6C84_06030 [Lachnospiraceae bacterium]|nr:hypothetical protein [Lachnospiraceae bacterium]
MIDFVDYYHIPATCKICGGVMVFVGVGEYRCEECGAVEYDDYGKVRQYLETHKGATAAEVELGTGVSQRTIRRLLKESRIEVAESSKAFLRCELCGKTIRSGTYCPECEVKIHRNLEEEQRIKKGRSMQGYSSYQGGDEGQRRFKRDQ